MDDVDLELPGVRTSTHMEVNMTLHMTQLMYPNPIN